MNRELFHLGPITIYWYSFFILTAFVVGYILAYREFKKEKLSLTFFSDYFFYLVPLTIIGARVYYVIFEWESYASNPLSAFAIWEGGLAIHGGVIAALLFTYYYTKKHHVNTIRLCDIGAPALILGQAIGRWGNFFNGEAYGPLTTLGTLENLHIPKFVIDGMYIAREGGYCHPTFFYESVGCFLGFLVIMLLRSRKKAHLGVASSLYFIIYGTIRFFIEALRQDSLMFFGLKVAQLVSILMVIAGLAWLNFAIRSNQFYHRKESVNE